MSVTSWDTSYFLSLAALITFCVFQALVLVVFVYRLVVTTARPQERRPRKQQRRRDNKGNARRFVLLEPLQPSKSHCPVHPEMDVIDKIVQDFQRTIEDMTRYMDTLNSETPEDSDSLTSITASDGSSSSRVSLSPSREESNNSTMTDNTSCSGADMGDASSIQPGHGHPMAGPEEQPGPATHPLYAEEVASCLDAEAPLHHNKGQGTLDGLIPESQLEQKLGLPGNVDDTAQDVPASAPTTPQRAEKDVTIIPIVRDLPFLDEAVKNELERHITKMKIQKRYGLQMSRECEQTFEYLCTKLKDSQDIPL